MSPYDIMASDLPLKLNKEYFHSSPQFESYEGVPGLSSVHCSNIFKQLYLGELGRLEKNKERLNSCSPLRLENLNPHGMIRKKRLLSHSGVIKVYLTFAPFCMIHKNIISKQLFFSFFQKNQDMSIFSYLINVLFRLENAIRLLDNFFTTRKHIELLFYEIILRSKFVNKTEQKFFMPIIWIRTECNLYCAWGSSQNLGK